MELLSRLFSKRRNSRKLNLTILGILAKAGDNGLVQAEIAAQLDASSNSDLSRILARLLKKGWIEAIGGNSYRLTQKGRDEIMVNSFNVGYRLH